LFTAAFSAALSPRSDRRPSADVDDPSSRSQRKTVAPRAAGFLGPNGELVVSAGSFVRTWLAPLCRSRSRSLPRPTSGGNEKQSRTFPEEEDIHIPKSLRSVSIAQQPIICTFAPGPQERPHITAAFWPRGGITSINVGRQKTRCGSGCPTHGGARSPLSPSLPRENP
jgi:hypothetical protein